MQLINDGVRQIDVIAKILGRKIANLSKKSESV
jgi:hypothetical protein